MPCSWGFGSRLGSVDDFRRRDAQDAEPLQAEGSTGLTGLVGDCHHCLRVVCIGGFAGRPTRAERVVIHIV